MKTCERIPQVTITNDVKVDLVGKEEPGYIKFLRLSMKMINTVSMDNPFNDFNRIHCL